MLSHRVLPRDHFADDCPHLPARPVRGPLSALLGAALIALVAASAPACFVDDRPVVFERAREVLGPLALKDQVAYVDSARDRVVAVDLSADRQGRITTHAIGRRAVFATTTPDRARLAVITAGEEAVVEGQVDQAPALWLVEPGAPDTDPVGYDIGSPFDRIAISQDGSVAVAYFAPQGQGQGAGGYFRNPNELAVVHLDQPPGDDNPVLRTVRSFGSAPLGVVLSPPMVIPGAEDDTPRTLAFVLAENDLTVLDATYPTRTEVSIRLDLGGEPVRPRELVFAPQTATVYVRSEGADDVLEILIQAESRAGGEPDDNDFQPALAELGAGGGPADIAVYDDADGRRLVLAATPGTRELVVIDADTGGFRLIAVPDPVDRVLLFPPGPDATPRVAVLASLGAGLARVHLLHLDRVTDELAPAELTEVDVSEPVLDVVPVPGRELGMLVHDDARTVLGLLDVSIGTVAPLQGVGRLDTYAFSTAGTHLIGATAGIERVGFLDLDNLHPSDLRLDDAPQRVFAIPTGAVFIDHGDPFGRATILPSPMATRDQAQVLTGFLMNGLLDQRR
ncbi:hypothetical protein [Haliangium sp.]|uniref:hypothetical protein n=1 Tax=Haliangium sp. TaxID=2663208 RepID=UPI003D0DFB76